MLDQYNALAMKLQIDLSASLLAYWQQFADLNENADYLKSRLHEGFPFNNKRARFGSAPGGETFQKGTAFYNWKYPESQNFNC